MRPAPMQTSRIDAASRYRYRPTKSAPAYRHRRRHRGTYPQAAGWTSSLYFSFICAPHNTYRFYIHVRRRVAVSIASPYSGSFRSESSTILTRRLLEHVSAADCDLVHVGDARHGVRHAGEGL